MATQAHTQQASLQITSTGGNGRLWVLVNEKDKAPIKRGDKIIGFRNETYIINGGTAPQHGSSTGRIETSRGELFPNVVDAKWLDTGEVVHA